MAAAKTLAVILAGGSGTRFWPLSQAGSPKQYLSLLGPRTLIQQTFDRLKNLCEDKHILICSSLGQKALIESQLDLKTPLILEPSARNTGPAVLLSSLELLARGYSEYDIVIVSPSDHFIQDTSAFTTALSLAVKTASATQGLVTLGIVPEYAHTGYGYIEAGQATPLPGVFKATQFVEKPDPSAHKTFSRRGSIIGIAVFLFGR